MRIIEVSQLEARLSECLRDVRRGEVFLVTDRGEVVAELHPPRTLTESPNPGIEGALEKLVNDGVVTPARLTRSDWTWQPRPLGMSDGTAMDLLDAVRSDRAVQDERLRR